MGDFGSNRHVLTNDERNKSGRGYTKHYYTVQDIAKMAGRAPGTIRNASAAGKINLDDLESVIRYILEHNDT